MGGTVLLFGAMACAACGGNADAAPDAARAPSHAGTVWELDHAADRAMAPASLLAFVNGLDVIVVDGNDLYAGTTRHKIQSGDHDARNVKLANGLTAQLVPAGDSLELRFSNGDSIPLRKRTVPEATGR